MLQNRFLIFLVAVALILGITTEIVVLYKTTNEGDIAKQESIIKLEAAKNAERLKAAEAAKWEADARLADEKAKTAAEEATAARLRQQSEAKLTEQKAAIELQAATFAAQLKKAEAAKMEAEAQLSAEKAKSGGSRSGERKGAVKALKPK